MVSLGLTAALTAGAADGFDPGLILRSDDPRLGEVHSTFAGDKPATNAFRAVLAREWPPGLVPVYAVERRGRYQLSRRPPKGQENFLEPLFFALPATGDTNATAIAGRWTVTATHRDGHHSALAWELTVEGDQVAGRFDPNTDYRFAFLTGGLWRTNRIELKVDYINDKFELEGHLTNQTFSGTWRRTDDGDDGVWQAVRPADSPGGWAEARTVALYEWIHPETGRRLYRPAGEDVEEPWQRQPEPLCRVWPP